MRMCGGEQKLVDGQTISSERRRDHGIMPAAWTTSKLTILKVPAEGSAGIRIPRDVCYHVCCRFRIQNHTVWAGCALVPFADRPQKYPQTYARSYVRGHVPCSYGHEFATVC